MRRSHGAPNNVDLRQHRADAHAVTAHGRHVAWEREAVSCDPDLQVVAVVSSRKFYDAGIAYREKRARRLLPDVQHDAGASRSGAMIAIASAAARR